VIAPKLDALRLARGPSLRARGWATGTRPGIELIEFSLARVRYRTSGSGPATIVFVADPPNVVEHYDRLVELLAPEFRVICLDMPGFGFSYPKRQFSYSIDDQVRVVTELLEHLGDGPYFLAFSCGAAFVAVGLAAQRPDLVAGVINIQAASWDEQACWARRVDLMGLVGTPILGQLLLASAPNWVARKWYDVSLPEPSKAEAFARIGSEALHHGACFCLASGLQQLQSSSPALGPVGLSAMVVWGSADPTHRRTDKSSSRACFPEARWHEFANAGHFPELEDPERFTGLIREFVAGE
jgi:pimeloyl-ACP methyl ester carboxylesterase